MSQATEVAMYLTLLRLQPSALRTKAHFLLGGEMPIH